MPPGLSGARSDRAQRRVAVGDRLLVAAERLLAQGEPYAAISVERLSREAELTRTTFYVYFEDKADLLHAWLERIETEIGAAATGGGSSTKASIVSSCVWCSSESCPPTGRTPT